MLNAWPVALLVGLLLGTLSGLGVGGGSLLILWLTMVLGMDQQSARFLNLLFFLPAAGIACLFRWKQGAVNWKKLLPAIFAGCLAAAGLSFVGQRMDTQLLKKLFGGLLVITGVRELLYRPRA